MLNLCFEVIHNFYQPKDLFAQAQCLFTGKSGQRIHDWEQADDDHESEREDESVDSQMQFVSGISLQS